MKVAFLVYNKNTHINLMWETELYLLAVLLGHLFLVVHEHLNLPKNNINDYILRLTLFKTTVDIMVRPLNWF